LAKKGDKRVFVVCPAFTFDCLETVEEIDIRAREQFAELCGGTLSLIPCLNSDIRFAKSLAEMMGPYL
jgi:ferrochelatase